jgi:hypothetical protein
LQDGWGVETTALLLWVLSAPSSFPSTTIPASERGQHARLKKFWMRKAIAAEKAVDAVLRNAGSRFLVNPEMAGKRDGVNFRKRLGLEVPPESHRKLGEEVQ